jgi:hypothetical protein
MNIISPQESDVEREHRQVTPPQVRNSFTLYEVVSLTVLILGAEQFFRTGNTFLIYIACLMAAAYAGPRAKTLLSVLLISAEGSKEC